MDDGQKRIKQVVRRRVRQMSAASSGGARVELSKSDLMYLVTMAFVGAHATTVTYAPTEQARELATKHYLKILAEVTQRGRPDGMELTAVEFAAVTLEIMLDRFGRFYVPNVTVDHE
jgi:diacylglycerol kinase family enzyme